MAVIEQPGEILTLCFMAFALGMDAFSVCIGLGMKGIRLRDVAKISLLNGFFHMFMPLVGILIGRYLSTYMGDLTIIIGGSLLILFGLNMIYSSAFGEEKDSWVSIRGWGLFLFTIGVSVDSFSVGLSLGLFSINMWLSIFCFGLAGIILTACGLLIGRRVSFILGEYGEAIGGIILLVFGIKFLL